MEDSQVVATAITSLIEIQGMLEVGIEEAKRPKKKVWLSGALQRIFLSREQARSRLFRRSRAALQDRR